MNALINCYTPRANVIFVELQLEKKYVQSTSSTNGDILKRTHQFQMWKKLDFRFRPIIQSTNDLHVVSDKNSTNSHCNRMCSGVLSKTTVFNDLA